MLKQTGRYATIVGREHVWELYTSVPAWPHWSEDIQSASLEGPFVAGRSGRVRFAGLPEGRFTIDAVDAPHSFVVIAHLLGGLLKVRFDHTLTQITAGTQIEESADFGGLLALPIGLIERHRIRRKWPRAMRAMTALARDRADETVRAG